MLALETSEHSDDDERGVVATGWTSFEPRCPFCQSLMVEEDVIAAWYIRKHDVAAGQGFTLGDTCFAEWRAEQHKLAHALDCEVYDRVEATCGCGVDERRRAS